MPSATCPTCCWHARFCTFSCMPGMAIIPTGGSIVTRANRREASHEPSGAGLRIVDAGADQFSGVHLLCAYVLQAANRAGLGSFGAFSAFLVALFTEMYGFLLTLYFLSGRLQSRFPDVDWLSHDAGHLLEMLFGRTANPHFGSFHLLSNVPIVVGFLVISAAWRVLYAAQQNGVLATAGPYVYVRHSQYVGFILMMFGFLLQWPTLLTLAMFPVLVWMYVRLAHEVEREAIAAFGDAYRDYAARVPGFIPHLTEPASAPKF